MGREVRGGYSGSGNHRMSVSRIPVTGPWITEAEIRAVAETAEHGWYDNAGTAVRKFERDFAEYLGVRFTAAVPHCTSAIHLSVCALGLGPGDEVIVPDITWIASAAPVSYVGATPVFADIDPTTWCLDPSSVEECITERTRAIIPVGLYGLTPDFDELRRIASKHNLSIIEDAAQTLGSRYGDRMAGTLGDVGVFSFHGTKIMTTGEGGMLVTDDEALFNRVQVLRDHGRHKEDFTAFVNREVAYKYRMSDLQAAFGAAQLSRIDELIEKKRTIVGWYQDRLSGFDALRLNVEPDNCFNTYWMSTVVFDTELNIDKMQFQSDMRERGIDTRPFFWPLSSLPAYSYTDEGRKAAKRNKTAYELTKSGVNLPSGARLTEADADRICNELLNIVGLS